MATVMKARQIRRERLGGVNPLLLCILPLALPIAIFHFVSGRIGNGLIASGAVVAGAVVVLISARSGGEPQPVVAPLNASDDHDDSDDGGSALLDLPTDHPLPGPFQAVWESIMRDGMTVDVRDPAIPTEHHQSADADRRLPPNRDRVVD